MQLYLDWPLSFFYFSFRLSIKAYCQRTISAKKQSRKEAKERTSCHGNETETPRIDKMAAFVLWYTDQLEVVYKAIWWSEILSFKQAIFNSLFKRST